MFSYAFTQAPAPPVFRNLGGQAPRRDLSKGGRDPTEFAQVMSTTSEEFSWLATIWPVEVIDL